MAWPPARSSGLIGPSGSGKTTLLKCLGAVIEPTRGRMTLGGEVIYDNGWKIPDLRVLRRDRIGFIFQAPYLIPFLDVTDNVALLPMLAGRPNAEARGPRAGAAGGARRGASGQGAALRAVRRRAAARVHRPGAGQPAAGDPGRRAHRAAGQRAGPGRDAHPQPAGQPVPDRHHRRDPRREIIPTFKRIYNIRDGRTVEEAGTTGAQVGAS